MLAQVKTFFVLALIGTAPAIINAQINAQTSETNHRYWNELSQSKPQIQIENTATENKISSYFPYVLDVGRLLWGWNPKELKNESVLPWLKAPASEVFKGMFVEFDVQNSENFRKTWFELKSGLKVRGLFAIHDFKEKRPFVILRMGIHGNVDELIAERFLLRLLYEDLNANVLVLESLTSHAFLTSNKEVSFGPIEEGLQSFLILNLIDSSFLKKNISNFYMVGISMGGGGTFVTSIMDNLNGQKIKKIVNFCPLINLKETFDFHSQIGIKNTLIDLWNARRLEALIAKYPNELKGGDFIQSLFDFKPRFTPKILDILNTQRKTPLISSEDFKKNLPNLKWPKGFLDHLYKSNSFYELNEFWPYYKNIKTPMEIITTPQDPLVVNALNSERIFNGQQIGDFSKLKWLRLEKGVHCSLPAVYEWTYLQKLLTEALFKN